MNAHTSIAAEPALQPVPNATEYERSVWTHLPGEEGVRLTLRCDLMSFRDRAAIGLMRCCGEAAPTLQEASRLATIYALANLPTKALFQMHIAVRSMIEAASAIESCAGLSARKTGGTDARG